MDKNKIKNTIGQLEKSIEDIEPHLNEEEYKEYCNNTYKLISFWKQQMKYVQS
jgi:hypothetical protein